MKKIQMLPGPVTLHEAQQKFPAWGYLRQPRRSTPIPSDIVGDFLAFLQRDKSHPTATTSPTGEKNNAIVYFNNCHNRDHVKLFGNGAFFDLGTSGRQRTQGRDLSPGQRCVVAERASDNQVTFKWYSFMYEALLRDERDIPARVFFGRLLASESLAKQTAASSDRYSALFKANGDLKNGSVFRKKVPGHFLPSEIGEDNTHVHSGITTPQVGGGFGDPVENKIVESAAVRAVVKAYEDDGWSVRSVERAKCGFDLECSRNGINENVEVKGVRGNVPCFIITAGEVEQARKNPSFVLMVVTSALSTSPKLTKYSGAEFRRRFDLSAIQYRAVLRS